MDAEFATKLDLPELEPGWVWLVGAGPGDPGLITLLGLTGLSQADVVLYDALVDEALKALLARQRSVEIDGSYAAYDKHPLGEPDAWGDLASFRRAAAASFVSTGGQYQSD